MDSSRCCAGAREGAQAGGRARARAGGRAGEQVSAIDGGREGRAARCALRAQGARALQVRVRLTHRVDEGVVGDAVRRALRVALELLDGLLVEHELADHRVDGQVVDEEGRQVVVADGEGQQARRLVRERRRDAAEPRALDGLEEAHVPVAVLQRRADEQLAEVRRPLRGAVRQARRRAERQVVAQRVALARVVEGRQRADPHHDRLARRVDVRVVVRARHGRRQRQANGRGRQRARAGRHADGAEGAADARRRLWKSKVPQKSAVGWTRSLPLAQPQLRDEGLPPKRSAAPRCVRGFGGSGRNT